MYNKIPNTQSFPRSESSSPIKGESCSQASKVITMKYSWRCGCKKSQGTNEMSSIASKNPIPSKMSPIIKRIRSQWLEDEKPLVSDHRFSSFNHHNSTNRQWRGVILWMKKKDLWTNSEYWVWIRNSIESNEFFFSKNQLNSMIQGKLALSKCSILES